MTTNTNSLNFNNHNEIRKAVKESYGARAIAAPVKTTATTTSVRDSPALNCCSTPSVSSCCASNKTVAATKMGYTAQDVASVPEDANLGLGCGAPLKTAGVQSGMTVLDLGSGAGFDVFLAAEAVGPTGRVIGVDMTPEMVAKARVNAEKRATRLGAPQPVIEFHEGLIEELPLADNLVDVVISNCVVNLSPDKESVFREAYRVLKPGGKLCVSDLVLTEALPSNVRNSLVAYMGCIAGAILMKDYLRAMTDAGFVDVQVTTKPAFSVLDVNDPIVGDMVQELEEGQTLDSLASRVVSATVTAIKQ